MFLILPGDQTCVRSPSNTVRRQRQNLPMSVGRASSHFRVVRQGYGALRDSECIDPVLQLPGVNR